uniref:Uncharacterized protein n=1 Tax=Oryza glumipatula TaxID=40148 RepID=A0A0D9YZP9_9ORYZ
MWARERWDPHRLWLLSHDRHKGGKEQGHRNGLILEPGQRPWKAKVMQVAAIKKESQRQKPESPSQQPLELLAKIPPVLIRQNQS